MYCKTCFATNNVGYFCLTLDHLQYCHQTYQLIILQLFLLPLSTKSFTPFCSHYFITNHPKSSKHFCETHRPCYIYPNFITNRKSDFSSPLISQWFFSIALRRLIHITKSKIYVSRYCGIWCIKTMLHSSLNIWYYSSMAFLVQSLPAPSKSSGRTQWYASLIACMTLVVIKRINLELQLISLIIMVPLGTIHQ